jgi:outer membrane protein
MEPDMTDSTVKGRQRTNRWRLASAGASLLLTGLGATAQERPADAGGDTLQLTLGAGVVSVPKYPGSSDRETRALPLINLRYGRYFLGGAPGTGVPLGLGVDLVEDPNWRLGVVLGPDLRKPRKASDDARLTGLGDIDATTHLGLFGGYSERWWSLRGNVLSDVGGNHEGTTASLDLEGRYPLGDRVVLSAGPGLTWADKRYTQTFFGVDATQAANSGLAPYQASAGVSSVKFSLGVEYRIDTHWFVSARASIESLRGDARSSPITTQTSPHTIGVFGGYRF